MLVNPLFISTIHRTCNAPYGCCSQQLVLMMTMAEPGSLWHWQIEIASAHRAGRQVVMVLFVPGETEIACPWS